MTEIDKIRRKILKKSIDKRGVMCYNNTVPLMRKDENQTLVWLNGRAADL